MRLATDTPRRFSLTAISADLITTVTPFTIGAPSVAHLAGISDCVFPDGDQHHPRRAQPRSQHSQLRDIAVLQSVAGVYEGRVPLRADFDFRWHENLRDTFSGGGVVVAEIVAGRSGLGYLLLFASSRLDMGFSLAILLVLALWGGALFAAIVWLERRLIFRRA
jgi:hypothetical protein